MSAYVREPVHRDESIAEQVREQVRRDHPMPHIGGSPGSYYLVCACGLYLTAKPSVRSCKRSFALHRVNMYAKAEAEMRNRG